MQKLIKILGMVDVFKYRDFDDISMWLLDCFYVVSVVGFQVGFVLTFFLIVFLW